jgi:hypothetical protein
VLAWLKEGVVFDGREETVVEGDFGLADGVDVVVLEAVEAGGEALARLCRKVGPAYATAAAMRAMIAVSRPRAKAGRSRRRLRKRPSRKMG